MERSELILLLRKERITAFNNAVKELKDYDLTNVNLRARNLSGANFRFADLRGAYLSNCTLKGVNLSHAKLEGASMHRAKISGAYLPKNVLPQEIINSINYGTRIRTRDLPIHENDALMSGEE